MLHQLGLAPHLAKSGRIAQPLAYSGSLPRRGCQFTHREQLWRPHRSGLFLPWTSHAPTAATANTLLLPRRRLTTTAAAAAPSSTGQPQGQSSQQQLATVVVEQVSAADQYSSGEEEEDTSEEEWAAENYDMSEQEILRLIQPVPEAPVVPKRPQLPSDIAQILGRLVSSPAAAAAASSSRFCTNCCAPKATLRGPGRRGPCAACGHSPLADASLLAPGALQRWRSHLRDQQQQQEQQQGLQQSQSGPHTAAMPAAAQHGAAGARGSKPGFVGQGGQPAVGAKGTRVALAFDERMLLHRASLSPHPERPERLQAILSCLESVGLLARCQLMPGREASDEELLRVHSRGLVRALAAASAAAAASSGSSSSVPASSAPGARAAGVFTMQPGPIPARGSHVVSSAAQANGAPPPGVSIPAAVLAAVSKAGASGSCPLRAASAAQPAASSHLQGHTSGAASGAGGPSSGQGQLMSQGSVTTTTLQAPSPSSGTSSATSGSIGTSSASASSSAATLASSSTSVTTSGVANQGHSSISTSQPSSSTVEQVPVVASCGVSQVAVSGREQVASVASASVAPSCSQADAQPEGDASAAPSASSSSSQTQVDTSSVSTSSGSSTAHGLRPCCNMTAAAYLQFYERECDEGEEGCEVEWEEGEEEEEEEEADEEVEGTSLSQEVPRKQQQEEEEGAVRAAAGTQPASPSVTYLGQTWDAEVGTIASDTLVSANTNTAARVAAGCAAALAEALVAGEADSGVAVIRPPGHHATRTMAQSGCYFNSAAVAARAAQVAGAQRVLIVDWDVHHGAGTQEIFEDDTSVMYVSLHRMEEEYFPGTGDVSEVGAIGGEGHTINIPWPGGRPGNADYLQAMLQAVLPVAHEFDPDLVIVSAGFDAAEGDPLGFSAVSPACFAHMTHLLKGVAPTLLLLEGGYNLDATARCMEACVRVLLGERPPRLGGGNGKAWGLSPAGTAAIMSTVQVQSEFWPSLHPLSLNGWMAAIREQQQAKAHQAELQQEQGQEEDWSWEEDESSTEGYAEPAARQASPV